MAIEGDGGNAFSMGHCLLDIPVIEGGFCYPWLLVLTITIVYTYSHSHFIAHIIEALGLTIHGNGGRDGDTICIFLCLNRALICCSTLEASAKWSFKGGLETLCQESEERISRCRVR